MLAGKTAPPDVVNGWPSVKFNDYNNSTTNKHILSVNSQESISMNGVMANPLTGADQINLNGGIQHTFSQNSSSDVFMITKASDVTRNNTAGNGFMPGSR